MLRSIQSIQLKSVRCYSYYNILRLFLWCSISKMWKMHLNSTTFTFSTVWICVSYFTTKHEDISRDLLFMSCSNWTSDDTAVYIESAILNRTDYIATWIQRSTREIACFACLYHINFIDLFNAFAKKVCRKYENSIKHFHTHNKNIMQSADAALTDRLGWQITKQEAETKTKTKCARAQRKNLVNKKVHEMERKQHYFTFLR